MRLKEVLKPRIIMRREMARFSYAKPTSSQKEIAIHLSTILGNVVRQNRSRLTDLSIEWNYRTRKYVVQAEREVTELTQFMDTRRSLFTKVEFNENMNNPKKEMVKVLRTIKTQLKK